MGSSKLKPVASTRPEPRTWRYPPHPEPHRLGLFEDKNDAWHVFRYPTGREQRRCIYCGLWETEESRSSEASCNPHVWNGEPA